MKKEATKEAIQKRGVNFLGKQAGEFLMDLANVPDWWVGQPPGAFTDRLQFERHQRWAEQMRKRYPEALRYCTSPEIIALRELLRKVWTARDLRSKEWFICLFRRFHSEALRRVEVLQKDAGKSLVREWQAKKSQLDIILMKPAKPLALLSLSSQEQVSAAFNDGPPHAGYFENCVSYLQRRLKKVHICEWKTCAVRPYFIADKPRQRYCSDICAREARLASKRKSWHEHPEWEKSKKGGK
jgi:hypothetical protein